MGAGVDHGASLFSNRVRRLLGRVEHQCARTPAEKEIVLGIRREADSRRGVVDLRADSNWQDEAFDEAPNAWMLTTFIDGAPATTLRIHVAAHEGDRLPSLENFPNAIRPHIRKGGVILDMTRLAARLEFARKFPELPYLALRPAWLAAEYFGADFVLATVAAEQQDFYRRAFGYEPWGRSFGSPGFSRAMACMGFEFPATKERIEALHPFLRSSERERDWLFRGSARRVAC